MRAATRGAISVPMRSDPVALTSATSGLSTSAWPSRAPAITSRCTAAGAPHSDAARSTKAEHAIEVRGVIDDGFHTMVSPQTKATAAFQDHTAAGKLNAVMTPTTPSGCHVSISRWPGRSDGIVRPSSWRDNPTAKSQISMASCTSPRDSERIFPASIVTSSATSALCSPSSSPRRLTNAPRTGAGTARHSRKALLASAIAASTSSWPAAGTSNNASPVIGERALTDGPVPGEERSTPQFSRASRARERSSSVDETDSSCWGWVVVIWLLREFWPKMKTAYTTLYSGRRADVSKRSRLNGSMSTNGGRRKTRSRRISPTAGAWRNPCPENPVA